VTNRLHTAVAFPEGGNYDTLVAEAIAAFSQDIAYAIEIVESARSLSTKRRKRNQSKA
jgi:hypothetical protein